MFWFLLHIKGTPSPFSEMSLFKVSARDTRQMSNANNMATPTRTEYTCNLTNLYECLNNYIHNEIVYFISNYC